MTTGAWCPLPPRGAGRGLAAACSVVVQAKMRTDEKKKGKGHVKAKEALLRLEEHHNKLELQQLEEKNKKEVVHAHATPLKRTALTRPRVRTAPPIAAVAWLPLRLPHRHGDPPTGC